MRLLYRFLWILFVLIAVFMMVFGAQRGEWKRIRANAEIVCTSCVGLSK